MPHAKSAKRVRFIGNLRNPEHSRLPTETGAGMHYRSEQFKLLSDCLCPIVRAQLKVFVLPPEKENRNLSVALFLLDNFEIMLTVN